MQKRPILLFCFLAIVQLSTAQKADSTRSTIDLSGAASVTNNGISLIPTFSLEKPAAVFNMSVGNKFSFDPEFAFSLEGKPWYFLFWFRYKLLATDKFIMNMGTHLGVNFKTAVLRENRDSNEVKIAERYLAAELSPNYFISKNISIGIYFLYSHGLDPTTVRNTNFVTINAGFSNIKLVHRFFMRIVPQFYYLNQGEHDGFYFTSAFTLARGGFPLFLSSVINKAIETSIPAGEGFVWNIILTYPFGK